MHPDINKEPKFGLNFRLENRFNGAKRYTLSWAYSLITNFNFLSLT